MKKVVIFLMLIVFIGIFAFIGYPRLFSKAPERVQVNDFEGPPPLANDKTMSMVLSRDTYENENLITQREGYELTYDVPFDTILNSNPQGSFAITGQDFEFTANITYPLEVITFSPKYSDEPYTDIALKNTTKFAIRKIDNSTGQENRYSYYQFGELYTGKDLWCNEDGCEEALRYTYEDSFVIDDSRPYHRFTANCTSASKEGLEKCDKVLQSLKFI